MSERDTDLDLHRAFHNFATATFPHIRPPGATKARATAHRHRRNRILGVSLAFVLLLVPATVVALMRFDGDTAPVPITPPTQLPSATSTPGGTASGTTPPTGSTPEPVTTIPAVAGAGGLADATLTLDWSWLDSGAGSTCKSGKVRFAKGVSGPATDGSTNLDIVMVTHVDVDADGKSEVVAWIHCDLGEVGEAQVIALKSSGSGYITVGRVVGAQIKGDIGAIKNLAGLSDGHIQVEVADIGTCCDVPKTSALSQWRTYGWTGSAFAQTEGPTTFDADASIANVTTVVAPFVLSAPVDGYRTGTIKVTVHNKGPQPARAVTVMLSIGHDLERAGGDWFRCNTAPDDGPVCTLGTLAVGQTVVLSLPVRRTVDADQGSPPAGYVKVRTGDYGYPPVNYVGTHA